MTGHTAGDLLVCMQGPHSEHEAEHGGALAGERAGREVPRLDAAQPVLREVARVARHVVVVRQQQVRPLCRARDKE